MCVRDRVCEREIECVCYKKGWSLGIESVCVREMESRDRVCV